MRILNFLKYFVAATAVAFSIGSASADKIAFVAEGQSYSGGGDVVTIPLNGSAGITYGSDEAVSFQITNDAASAQIVDKDTGIRWASANKLILTAAEGVVINSVTFSCTKNFGTITLVGTELSVTGNSSNPIVTLSGIEGTGALEFKHNLLTRCYYIEVEYNSPSSPDVETVDLNATLKPETIQTDYAGEVRMILGGIFGEFGTEMPRSTFEVEVKTANSVSTTTVSLKPETDWTTWEDYYLLTFATPFVAGTYTITFPEGAFVRKNDDGDIMVKSSAKSIKLTVTDAGSGPIDPDAGFFPIEIYPTADSTVDPSETDWIIALTFEQKVTTNQTITPYLLLEDQKFEADGFMDMAAFSNPKQANAFFDGMNQRPNGTYTFVLPAGAVSYADGQTNKTYTTTFIWEGGKNGDIVDEDCKLVAASIGDVNIMEAGAVVPNIPSDGCNLKLNVLPESIETIYVSIIDVTGKTPDEYDDPNIEAIWASWLESYKKDNQGNVVPTNIKVDGVFTKEIYSINGYTLYEGHDYIVKVDLYNGSYYTTGFINLAGTLHSEVFTGTTPAFKYSTVEIVSIVPEPGSEFKIGDKMVVTYSAPVKLVAGEGKSGFGKGNAGWANFSSMGSNADKTVWTITFPNAEINAAGGPDQINPRLWGTDLDGNQLRPAKYDIPAGAPETDYQVFNGGVNETSYTQVNYSGYAKCPKVEVAPLATEELSYIDFNIVGNKEMNPSYLVAFPEIKNAAGDVVAVVLVDDYEGDSEDSTGHIIITSSTGSDASIKVTGIRVPLNNVITTPGIYTLELPWNLFVVGSEQSSYASAPGIFMITVGDPSANKDLSFSCEDGSDLTSTFIPEDEEDGTPAHYMISIVTENEIANVVVEIPEGFDSMYYAPLDPAGMKRVAGSEMEEAGYTKGNVIPVPADQKEHGYQIAFGKDDEVDVENLMMLVIKADKKTGIEIVENGVEPADYYTIDGLKVENPVKGLYIKVQDGKASKVIL